MHSLYLADALYLRTPLKLKPPDFYSLRWLSPNFLQFSRNENVKVFLIPLVQAVPVG